MEDKKSPLTICWAEWILVCDKNFTIWHDAGIVFDTHIYEISDSKIGLQKRYPHAQWIDCGKNSVIMPSLVNSHVHLEFSHNTTQLVYGEFFSWMKSVIQKRVQLQDELNDSMIDSVLDLLKYSGIGTIGAISSFGLDLLPLIKSQLRTVYFIEAVGSNPEMASTLTQFLDVRLNEAQAYTSSLFQPSIALHSPYALSEELAKYSINIAMEKNYPLSVHFMESLEERQWCDNSMGKFAPFFEEMLSIKKSLWTGKEFCALLPNNSLIVHGTFANDDELTILREKESSIIHCPVSNRLLTHERLSLNHLNYYGFNIALATDGLSSNYSLNLWDEMRAALLIHYQEQAEDLAEKLLLKSTLHGAKALGTPNGSLEEGKEADLIVIHLPNTVDHSHSVSLYTILHTHSVDYHYLRGELLCSKSG